MTIFKDSAHSYRKLFSAIATLPETYHLLSRMGNALTVLPNIMFPSKFVCAFRATMNTKHPIGPSDRFDKLSCNIFFVKHFSIHNDSFWYPFLPCKYSIPK